MGIFGRNLMDDDEYFKRKATVMEYDRKIMHGEVKPSVSAKMSKETLYQEARKTVGDISFSEITKSYPDLFVVRDKKEILLDLGMAAAIGTLAFVIGEAFVGTPDSKGAFAELSDAGAENFVASYAEDAGYSGQIYKGKDQTHSAIQYLEDKFKVPYDYATSSAVDGVVENMKMSNHHFYQPGHNLGFGGLITSLKDQFNNTATFIQPGSGDIAVITGTGKGIANLAGRSMFGKLVAGFSNWYGHCMSDLCGYSGARGRGSGLPIPMMQYMSAFGGKMGGNEFSNLICQVYEQGYDYRFGNASSIPVVLNDTLVRIVWAAKQYCLTKNFEIPICYPKSGMEHYDLSNMLLMSNAVFLAMDTGHAALISYGDPLTFLSNCNFKEWFNFSIAFSRDFLLTVKRAHDVKKNNTNYLQETMQLYADMKWDQ